MAGKVQLAAFGTADEFISGDPEITYWKSVFRRHTPFAMESVALTFNGTVDFGRRVTCIVPRSADLIYRLWLQITVPDLTGMLTVPAGAGSLAYVNNIGHVLISSIEVELGGTRLDRHDGAFLDLWSELTVPESKRAGFNEMVGRYDAYDPSSAVNSFSTQRTLYVPIQFYFNRFPGMAIPLVALQFSELRINLELRNYLDCVRSTRQPVQSMLTSAGQAPSIVDATLYADMVYLDSDERRRFSQIPHEYLMEATQFLGDQPSIINAPTARIDLFLNHPVKVIFWTFVSRNNQTTDTLNGNRWFEWQDNVFAKCAMQINGVDRFRPRPGSYFRLVQPYQHFARTPKKNVCVYSFALQPEESQPSGEANFSRLEGSQLALTLAPGAPNGYIKVYALNYNVLRIASGTAALSLAA